MCLRPVSVRYSNAETGSTGWRSILVPCGKCLECLKDYQNAWFVRMFHELQAKKIGVFFTLTYADENATHLERLAPGADVDVMITKSIKGRPFVYHYESHDFLRSVCKNDLQAALKRFRTNLSRKHGKSFSYFLTSEYGPQTLRPHYHGIIFGVTLDEFRLFSQDWEKRYGFVSASLICCSNVKEAQNKTRYTAKYCSKGFFENPFAGLFVDKTFHLISKGIGKSYVINNENINYHRAAFVHGRVSGRGKYSPEYLQTLSDCMRINIQGFSYKMPRYYKEAFYRRSPALRAAYSDFVLQRYMLRRENEFSLIQPDGSSNTEGFRQMLGYDCWQADQREAQLRDRFAKFYGNSYI